MGLFKNTIAYSSESEQCNFPFDSSKLGFLIKNPTCEQVWNLYNFHKIISVMLHNQVGTQYKIYQGAKSTNSQVAGAIKIAQSALDVVSISKAAGVDKTAEAVATAVATAYVDNLTRWLLPNDSLTLNSVLTIKNIVIKVDTEAASKGVTKIDPAQTAGLVLDSANIINDFATISKIDTITERMHEAILTSTYLLKYYRLGGKYGNELAFYYDGLGYDTLTNSTSEMIDFIAENELKYINSIFGDSYSNELIVENYYYYTSIVYNLTKTSLNKG